MRQRTLWWIIPVLLILLAAGGGYGFWHSGKSPKQAESAVKATPAGDLEETSKKFGKEEAKEPPIPAQEADVVLIGSELEGMYLARAAADEGLKVLVLDPKDEPGGQLLQAQMLFLDETRDASGKSLVQGRAKELFDGFKQGKIRKLSEFAAYYNKLTSGIPIESGIQITKVVTADDQAPSRTIDTIVYKTAGGQLKQVKAGYWVENTDNAALVQHLHATRLPGLEKFYGQSTIEYMSASMMMKFKNVDWAAFNKTFNSLTQQEKNARFGGGYIDGNFALGLQGVTKGYKPTSDRLFLRGLNAVNQRDGEVLINALLVYTVDPSDPASVKEAVELGNKETPLIAAYFRKTLPGWEKADVNGYPSYPYIREYNHYESDYVLQVSDALGGRMFDDNVSIAGYPLDLQGTSANRWGIEMGRPDKYGMPLRSFLLKGYENVILAGKNVGSSAIAYGSTRIQPNTSLAAESIGVILGRIHGRKALKALTAADWPELHAYLESKYQIKLTGVVAQNKLAGWSDEEKQKLDAGQIIFPQYVHRGQPARKK